MIASSGREAYTQLCAKVLPSLNSAFNVGTIAEANALTNVNNFLRLLLLPPLRHVVSMLTSPKLASDLLSILAEHGLEPLPPGFVATVMPRLSVLLLQSQDEELLKSATTAVKNMLMHDWQQLFEWRDESGKGGLEVVLMIISRLLGPDVDDNAAAEVGGLAAELVEKAGSERLGPYLMELLKAVAIRLGSATQAQFIQSLILVFARLSLVNAKEVVDFLAQVQVGSESALQTVMSKWLENSVTFAGYDEIRQK